MKNFLRKIYKTKLYKYYILLLNYVRDFQLYIKHSNVFKEINHLNKKEAKLILNYHSIEKGFLHEGTRLGFAKERVQNLNRYLSDSDLIKNVERSQIKTAYLVMCKYYEFHQSQNYDLSSYYSKDLYDKYKKVLEGNYNSAFSGTIDYKRDEFYSQLGSDFKTFSYSRKSIRNFTGEMIDDSVIQNAIQLALNSPSVCNRQASKVYLLDNKKQIDEVLRIQGGFSGFSQNVSQLLIVTNDRNYYYTIGERNQFYIDGGIFLMNMLYALHYYKIACCPANWGKEMRHEKMISKVVDIPKSEQIICIVPIGVAKESFKVTLSERRQLMEVFSKI